MNQNIEVVNPPGMPDPGKEQEQDFYWKCCCWFMQVVDWILLSILIIIIINNSEFILIMAIAFVIVHFIYIILEISSPIGKYLCHKSYGEDIYQKMSIYFRTPPKIIFHCECYHNEVKQYTNKKVKTKKVVNYTGNSEMPYRSGRDVSGLFYLNCDQVEAQKKVYIKLKLIEEINFADTISILDYHNEINEFFANNRKKDVFFKFSEERNIPGLIHHNLIKLRKDEPFLTKYFFFILSTLLTLSELYKLYFDYLCIFQKFKIRKLISTRYDLNQPDYQNKYRPLIPQINLINQIFNYQPQDYNYLNSNRNDDLKLPTQKELEEAKKYQDKIPDYQVSNGKGKIHEGVIIDSISFSCYKANPNNLKPAPTILNTNNQPHTSSCSIKASRNNQITQVENQETDADNSRRPYLYGQQNNIFLQTQIQEKAQA